MFKQSMPLILRTIEFDIFNEGMTKTKVLEPGEATRWETIPAGAEGSPSLAFEPEVSSKSLVTKFWNLVKLPAERPYLQALKALHRLALNLKWAASHWLQSFGTWWSYPLRDHTCRRWRLSIAWLWTWSEQQVIGYMLLFGVETATYI